MFSKVGLDAAHDAALDPVRVLVEEAEPEHAERVGVRHELLHDQVVVLASLDVGTVLAHGEADLLVAGLVLVLDRLELGIAVAPALDHELVEGIARARGGRRTEHLDLHVGELGVDVLPGLVRIRNQLAARARNLLREREEELL